MKINNDMEKNNIIAGSSEQRITPHHHKRKFFERLFTHALAKADQGSLDVFLPDGRHLLIGNKADSKNRAVIYVRDWRFFSHSVLYGDTGFGEAFTEGWWDSPDVLRVLDWFLLNSSKTPTFAETSARSLLVNALGIINYMRHIARPNSVRMAKKNIADHYDLSNDLYRLMLDESMAYSCAMYFTGNETLEEAQRNKFEALCRKLSLRAEDHLLEIGSGWGGFAIYAAQNYGCRVTTVTISQEQFDFAKRLIQEKNLTDKIEIRLQDYRHIQGQFDKIVSIEMVEALGLRYYDTFFRKIHSLLKPKGIVAIQCITYPDKRFADYMKRTDWIQKHIFPGSLLMSQHEMRKSMLRTGDLEIYHIESIGLSYVHTLSEWRKRFNENRDKILKLKFDERFIRKWNFYLYYCEAGFTSRYINAVQIVLSRPENRQLGDYHGPGI